MEERGWVFMKKTFLSIFISILVLFFCFSTNVTAQEWEYDWDTRLDVYGKSAGHFDETPFPITETTTEYSIKNDEFPDGRIFYLGTKHYVDGKDGTDSGDCLSFGSPCATIGYALSQTGSGNNAIIIRGAHDGWEGTYHESGLSLKAGINDSHRFILVGYGQERPVIDGSNTTSYLMNIPQTDNAYVTIQRLKIQNCFQEAIAWGGKWDTTNQNYVNFIDIESYQISMLPPADFGSDVTNGHFYAYDSDYNWFYHLTVHKTYAHCLKIGDGSSYNVVEWSHVYDCGWWDGIGETQSYGRHPMGIDFPNSNPDRGIGNIARYNIAHDTQHYTLYARNNMDFDFHHNEFYNGWRCVDMMTDTYNDCYLKGESYGVAEIHGQDESYGGKLHSNIIRSAKGVNSEGEVGLLVIFGSGFTGNTYIYNNLFYDDNNVSEQAIWFAGNTGSEGTFNVYNNNFYLNTAYTIIDDQRSGPVELKNNIFYQAGPGSIISGAQTHEYNQYYAPEGSLGITLSTGEMESDPQWVLLPSGEYNSGESALTEGSPARDQGIDLTPVFTSSFNGISRPQGPGWDMGAYEYIEAICEPGTYYVDFQNGSDSNNGLCTSTPFKHAPGDDNAQGNAASVILQPGNRVVFKGGVTYNGRIDADWSGTEGSEIIYTSGHLESVPWGTERAIIDGTGITFSSGMGVISVGSSDYIIVRGLDVRNLPSDGSYSGKIGISSGEHIMIDNCLLHDGGGNGIMMYGVWDIGSRSDDIRIVNNEIYRNRGHGILLLRGISNILIENNTIHDNGWPDGAGQSDGIFGGGNGQGENTLENVTIRNNIIYDNPGKGPCLIGGNNILIERNYFYTTTQTQIGLEIAPTAGINTNVTIRNNIIDIDTFYDGTIRIRAQWDPEDGLDGLKIYNNTITRIGNYWAMHFYSGGTTQHSIRNIDIKNNVFAVRETPYNGFEFEGDVTYGLESDYNHYFDEDSSMIFRWTDGSNLNFNDWQGMGFDTFTHQQWGDPLYTNSTNILGPDGILWTDDDGLIPQQDSPLCGAGEGGSDIGTYDCPVQTYHRSDTNHDGCIETGEMVAFMDRWKISVADVSMSELIESISLWKSGTGCI